jgi:hypothetical protein
VKRRLALRYRDDRRAYTDAKVPFLWEVIRRARARTAAARTRSRLHTSQRAGCAAASDADPGGVR